MVQASVLDTAVLTQTWGWDHRAICHTNLKMPNARALTRISSRKWARGSFSQDSKF